MRPVTLHVNDPQSALQEIERASHENDVGEIANNFVLSGAYTANRSFDASAATLAELRVIVATLLADLQKGGMNRTT